MCFQFISVDAEGKRTNKTTLSSEWRSALKKSLTEPALLEMSGKRVNRDLVGPGHHFYGTMFRYSVINFSELG